jgi:hypothetical protein
MVDFILFHLLISLRSPSTMLATSTVRPSQVDSSGRT